MSPVPNNQHSQQQQKSALTFSPPPQRSQHLAPLPPRRSATMPTPAAPADVEPLSFAKVPVTRPLPASTLLNMSTDTEGVTSDGGEQLSRSPSLLTSLIQSQSRIVSASSSVANSPSSSAHFSSLAQAKPILRRASSGHTSGVTSGDDLSDIETKRGRCPSRPSLAVALGQRLEPLAEQQGSPEPAHRRSRLKFAVTPRPLQLVSACSSQRASPEPVSNDLSDDEYDDEDLATPGFYSDSDGYREDSEDGFTSDDEPFLPPAHWGQRRPSWTPYRAPSAPILQGGAKGTPDAPAPARARIRIDDDRSNMRCSRHRSPPPVARRARDAAPPAARSPSAYELCRRRGSTGARPSLGYSGPKPAKGWKSDDSRPALPARTSERARSLTHKVSARELSRRDSAPARVDEVTVTVKAEPQPKGGLRKVLTAFR